MIDLEKNKQLALDLSKAIASGDWDKLDQLLSVDFTYDGDGVHMNKDEYIGFMQGFYLSMHDMRLEFPQVYAEDEFVTVRFVNQMKNAGKFMGLPASGKTITNNGIFIRQIRDDKIIKENQITDLFGMIKQMGFKAIFMYVLFNILLKIKPKPPARKTNEEMKKLIESINQAAQAK